MAPVLFPMIRRVACTVALALALVGCSDDGTAGGASDAATDDDGGDDDDDASTGASAADEASDVGSGDADTAGVDTSTGAADGDAGTSDDGTDTAGGAGPIELYRGAVIGGEIPGWNPEDPRPLVMLGRQGTDWIATLARIGDDGALSDNVAEEIVVWGWDAAVPPILYDGPVVGGAIPGWSADAPIPVVMLGRLEQGASWFATLASIAPDGSLGDNVGDRIVVWGWPAATPGAPAMRYGGPIDDGAVLRGWDPDVPVPLVMLGRVGETWQSTLARIAADGRLSDNVAEELRVFGW